MPKYRQKATIVPLAFASREFKKIQYIKNLIHQQTVSSGLACISLYCWQPGEFFQSTGVPARFFGILYRPSVNIRAVSAPGMPAHKPST